MQTKPNDPQDVEGSPEYQVYIPINDPSNQLLGGLKVEFAVDPNYLSALQATQGPILADVSSLNVYGPDASMDSNGNTSQQEISVPVSQAGDYLGSHTSTICGNEQLRGLGQISFDGMSVNAQFAFGYYVADSYANSGSTCSTDDMGTGGTDDMGTGGAGGGGGSGGGVDMAVSTAAPQSMAKPTARGAHPNGGVGLGVTFDVMPGSCPFAWTWNPLNKNDASCPANACQNKFQVGAGAGIGIVHIGCDVKEWVQNSNCAYTLSQFCQCVVL